VTEALHATVYGRVQGVGFRDFAWTRANALGLTGYVRNLHGGAVEIVAEGEREALESLLEELRRGPRGSRVDDVDARWEEATGTHDRFDVTF
jgi:acylphosphatase